MRYRKGGLLLLFGLLAAAAVGAEDSGAKGVLTVHALESGPVISRHIFGQFAEHLGHGIYEGIWVGPDSPIPNTRGIRNDVVTALKAIKVPNVRWPGGYFADEYHWRNGIGPADKRNVTLNPNWGGVIEPNSFGTHEFMDFADQIGADSYVSVNLGSGSPHEAAQHLPPHPGRGRFWRRDPKQAAGTGSQLWLGHHDDRLAHAPSALHLTALA